MPKALYLEGLLRELGVTDILRIDAPDPRVPDGVRPNVVARIPGASPRRLWILGHMDVVPPGELSYWKTDPWKVVVDGDKDPWPWRGGQSAGHRLRPAHCHRN